MGGAVGTDLTGPVDGKGHVQILQRDVVQQLIVGPLQKGRIDGDDRLHAVAGDPGGQGHGVLLGDADVEVAFGIVLRESRPDPSPRTWPG